MDQHNSLEYGAIYNRLMRQNAMVRWTHFALAVVAVLCYESRHSPEHYAFWRSSGWLIIATLALPAWPYALSCISIWRRTTTAWARPWIFCFILAAITIGGCLWYLSDETRQLGLIGNLCLTMFQCAGFYYFAQWTFDDLSKDSYDGL